MGTLGNFSFRFIGEGEGKNPARRENEMEKCSYADVPEWKILVEKNYLFLAQSQFQLFLFT